MPAPSVLLVGAAVFVAALGGLALVRWRNRLRWTYAVGATASAWWLVCQAVESQIADASTRHLVVRASFAGIVIIPTVYGLMAARVAGLTAPLTLRSVFALGAFPFATLLMAAAPGTRAFFSTSAAGDLVPGPAYWVHVAYSLAAFMVAVCLLAWAALAGRASAPWRMSLLVAATALPALVSVFDLARPEPLSLIDPTAFSVAVSMTLIFVTIGPLRLLDTLPANWAAAFAASAEALVVLDDTQRVTAVSDRAADMLKRPMAAIVGERLESLLPGSERALTGARSETIRIELRGHDAFQQFGLKVSDLPEADGAGSRVVAIRDDTARALELTAARIQYRDLFDDYPQAIMVHDPSTLRIVSANRTAEQYYRWPPGRLAGLSVAELWASDDEAGLNLYAAASSIAQSKRSGLHRRRDGSKFEVEYRSRAAGFDGVAATVLIVDDVTEQRESQRTSARLNAFVTTTAALWRSSVDAIQAPLLVLDDRDRIFNLNRSAARALGTDVRTAVGLPFAQFCGKPQCRAALELAQETRRTGQPSERFLDDLPDGSSCSVRASAVAGTVEGEGARTVVLMQDTTAVVQLQRKLNNEAAFARLGQIVAAVAHDVRTPLASLSVNLDALAVERAGDASIEASLPALYRSISRINNLMSALLDYGRPTGEISRGGDVVEVTRAAIATNAERASARGVVVELSGEPLLKARMEKSRIQQAIENLVSNGIQHAPPGSSVSVEVRIEGEGEAVRAVCRVSDQGEGFRPDVVARVFEPFYSRRQGGTGLGLAIVKRIAEQHGGAVRAENQPTGGAVVTMEWPIA